MALDDTFRLRLDAARELCQSIGMQHDPLSWRVMWRLGIPIPPPCFLSPRHYFLMQFVVTGLMFSTAIWIGLLEGWWMMPIATFVVSTVGNLSFRRKVRRLRLPSWNSVTANVF